MANYRVSFFKIERKVNEDTGKSEKTGDEDYLGSVVIDDTGTKEFSLVAKAFRVCHSTCLYADKTITEKL